MQIPDRTWSSDKYRYGFQDQETGWSAFELRMYDTRIARWSSIDPYNQYWSPYLAMGNTPINGVDIDGGCFEGDCPDGPGPWATSGSTTPDFLDNNIVINPGDWWQGSDEATFLDLDLVIIPTLQKVGTKILDAAETELSHFTLFTTGIVMPLINQTPVLINEEPHEGYAWDSNNEIDWAVPYKLENWRFTPQNQLRSDDISWNDGKEIINSTTDVMLTVIPNTNVPGKAFVSKTAQKGVTVLIGTAWKAPIKKGVEKV